MRPFDVVHRDPAPLARSAAVRSRVEQDPNTRDHARRLSPSERLRAAFELARQAAKLRDAA